MSLKKTKLNITELQDFVLDERNIEKIFKHIQTKDKIKQKKPIEKKIVHEIEVLLPHFKDKLFWCYYILTKGHSSYEMIHKEGFKESTAEKIKLIEEIRLKKFVKKINGKNLLSKMI